MPKEYTQDDMDRMKEDVKDTEGFRIRMQIFMDNTTETLRDLQERPKICEALWRMDILWFCGVPAGIAGFVWVIFFIVGRLNGSG